MLNFKKAFTLIELSIALIVICLIVVSINYGQTVINAAKMRSIITLTQTLQADIKVFKSTYNALPGDFTNAAALWGSTTCVAGDTNIDSTKCNGNGDGMIGGSIIGVSPANSVNATAEGTRSLQHLSLAGIVQGNYVGGNSNFVLGSTIVRSAIDGAGYNILYSVTGNALASNAYITYGNYLVFSKASTVAASLAQPGAGALQPTDAYYIDQKIDDGYPTTGNSLAYTGYANTSPSSCTTISGSTTIYNQLLNDQVCVLMNLLK